jgi:folylpolyglutamate synthase/dihydrofolate synthase
MPFEDTTIDEPFFREWKERRPGDKRSIYRASRLAGMLSLSKVRLPVLTVVGSKGKGTTALYASAVCAAAGLKVGTLSSPPTISNRERIRVNGRAIGRTQYQELAAKLNRLLLEIGKNEKDKGYLSPTGLYTLMGISCMLEHGCDVLVLEAGMGGRSDEVSLFAPKVVAVTRIFEEHIGIIGNNATEITWDKLGVVLESTTAVLSINQDHPEVLNVFRDWEAQAHRSIKIVQNNEPELQNLKVQWPPGLSAWNAKLGYMAARKLLESTGISPPSDSRLRQVTATIRALGRLSQHRDAGGRTWTVDAAIDERGVAEAIRWHEDHIGSIDSLLVCMPTIKNIAGVRRALSGRDFVPVRIPSEHLEFSDKSWDREEIDFDRIDQCLYGERILAIGTWSFVGAVFKKLGLNYESAFDL